MAISWDEIKHRAMAFSREFADEQREQAEAKTFWDEFFNVFGVNRRRLASFEEAVRKLDGNYGFIDLFWKGTLLVEHKSRGKDLDKTRGQTSLVKNGLYESVLKQKNEIPIPSQTKR